MSTVPGRPFHVQAIVEGVFVALAVDIVQPDDPAARSVTTIGDRFSVPGEAKHLANHFRVFIVKLVLAYRAIDVILR